MNKYAVVIATDKGYLYYANALMNSIQAYGANVDFYVGIWNWPPIDFAKVPAPPSNVHLFDILQVCQKPDHPIKVSGTWWLQFGRYCLAELALRTHEAVVVFDADQFVCGDLTPTFDLCNTTRELVMVRNSLGYAPSNEQHIDNFNGACTPPFHCCGSFYNQSHRNLLLKVFDWGTREDYNDMSGLWRTIRREGYDALKVIQLNNDLWIMNTFYGREVVRTFNNGLPELHFSDTGERIMAVHGRWNPVSGYRADEVNNCRLLNQMGYNNTVIFAEMYEHFTTNATIKVVI